MSRTRSRTRVLALPATVAVLVLLAACSDGPATPAATATPSQAPAAATGQRMPGGGGTMGEIAAVSDALMQVQGLDGQTAVTWDASTAITQTVAGALSDVTVGSCVTALPGTSTEDDAAAASVAISPATDGECGGPGGVVGDGPTMLSEGEMPERPAGAPTDLPDRSDLPDDAIIGGTVGRISAGLVTAVSGSTITVEPIRPDDDTDTTPATITVDDATTYTTQAGADASAIAVGRCVSAQGEADDSGKVAASSLLLSDAGDAGCTPTMVFSGEMPPGAPGAPGGSSGFSRSDRGGSDDA